MKRLELIFENEEGRTVRFSLDSPNEPVNIAAVNAAMDEIIAQNVFITPGGQLVAKRRARLVENIVEEIDLGLEE